jgi:hypothetical protein
VSSAPAPRTTIVLVVSDALGSGCLQDALASVSKQRRTASVVVVDNASTNPLPPLPGAWLIRAPRRLSAGAARNLGLARATTPYIVFWEADEVMLPGTLETLETALDAVPALVAFCHGRPGRVIARLAQRPRAFALVNAIWPLYESTGATIMRAELARAAGGYSDSDASEDWPLSVALAWRGRLGWSGQPGRLARSPQLFRAVDLRQRARRVRERIRGDGGIPDWVRTALPVVWVAQEATLAARVGLEWLRQRLRASAA